MTILSRYPEGDQTLDSKEKSLIAAQAAREKKAKDLIIFHVAHLTTIADYFLICSAESQRQVKAIMEHVDSVLSKAGEKVFSVEGENTFRWVLMDYSDLIVHVFEEEVRGFYALERLWGDAPKVEIKEPVGDRKKRSGPKPVRKAGQSRLKKGRAV